MAISLGSIVVELLANTASFTSGMNKASYEAKKSAKEMQASFAEAGNKIGGSLSGVLSQFGQFGSVISEFSRTISESLAGVGKNVGGLSAAIGVIGGVGAAAITAAAGMAELGKSGAEIAEKFSLVSQKTGISIRDLQIFAAAGSTVDVSLEDMVVGIRRFDQALLNTGRGGAAQGVLASLGVTARDNKEALLQVADAFSKMEDGPRKASDAVALFGKSGLNLIPLLNKGRDGFNEWADAVDKLGPVIGKEAVAANEKYKASVTELGLAWDKVKLDVEQSVVPGLAKAGSWLAENFQSIKAGFAGGIGAAAALKDQQAIQAATTDATKQESAAKDASLQKQEELNNSLQRTFQTLKAGGAAAYALEQARLELTGAEQNGLWEQATAIQSQIPALEKAAALEAQRNAEAKRSAASYAAVLDSIKNIANLKPILPRAPQGPDKGIEALFGPQTKDPLAGSPDLGQPEFLKSVGELPNLLSGTLSAGKQALDNFYSKWNQQAKGTVDSINSDYDAQIAHFDGLLHLGEISQQQFNDVSLKLEGERQAGLKKLRQDTGTSTWFEAWQDMFTQLEQSGKDFARSITQDIGGAIEGLNQQLAHFVATGKGLNFKQIGQSLTENLASSFLKKGESTLFGSLGSLFGLSSTKPDGSTAQNALWVQFAGSPLAAAGAGLGSLPLGDIGSILGNLTGNGSNPSGFANPLGSLLGSFGSIFGSIGSFFGGFLADGGDTQAGKAYIVGEKRPELFVPGQAGRVIPNVVTNGGDTKVVNVTNHFNGVSDMDSFKRSGSQISRQLGGAVSRATSRA